jgi:hypothetical protein
MTPANQADILELRQIHSMILPFLLQELTGRNRLSSADPRDRS